MLKKYVVLLSLLSVAAVVVGCDSPPAEGEGEGEGEGEAIPSAGCGGVVDTSSHVLYPFSVTIDGRVRDARVVFPVSYDPTVPLPVIFTFHGDQDCVTPNSNPDGQIQCDAALAGPIAANTFGIEGALGEEAIIISLDAENLNRFENFFSWETVLLPAQNPDILAVQALHDRVNAEFCTDTSRTFAVGFSGGGFFTHSLACFGEPLTGIAVFEGGFEDGSFGGVDNDIDVSTCVAAPLNVLIVHATSDATVPPEYGALALDVWSDREGCDSTQTTVSDLDAECVSVNNCGSNLSYCTPADAVIGHSVWSPEGTQVLVSWLRRFF